MRNLKRALSLTLASVMLLGMMVVGSSAAGFPDVDENDNIEAIEVLQAVKVMVGDDNGNFGPDDQVNRAQMAVVMALLLDLDYDYYEGTDPGFWDVPNWAKPYVAACYANGIVSGYGNGQYGAADPVTAVQAASMMMRALGYFKYQSDYASGFELSTVTQASKIELFKGVNAATNTTALTRNQVAKMALNALQTPIVEPDDNTLNITTSAGNATTTVTGGRVNYTVVASTQAFARAIDDTERQAGDLAGRGGYTVELGEKLYSGDLKLYDDRTDDFGRPARHWEYKGDGIGTYMKKELIRAEYTKEVTGKDLYDLLGSDTIRDYSFDVTIDGVGIDGKTGSTDHNTVLKGAANSGNPYFDETYMTKTYKSGVGKTGKGVLTQVFVNPDTKHVDVAVINTYLAKATADYSEKKDEASFDVYALTSTGSGNNEVFYKYVDACKDTTAQTKKLTVTSDDFAVEDVKKDDIVLVTVANGTIKSINEPEVLSAATLTAFSKDSYVISEGTQYDYNTTIDYDPEVLDDYTSISATQQLKDTEYNLFLDAYGYLIGVEVVDAVKNYVFLTGIDLSTSNLKNKTADAAGILLDGTFVEFRVDMEDSEAYWNHGGLSYAKTATTTGKFTAGPLWNTWCTYTVDKDGVYTLKEVKDLANVTGGDKAKAGQYHDAAYSGKDIDDKHVSLKSSASKYAYGNDKSIYIVAELDDVTSDTSFDADTIKMPDNNANATKNVTNTDKVGIISGVDSIATGITNVNLKTWTAEQITSEVGEVPAYSGNVYTLFDKDGYVIAAVVVGEDDGSTKNLIYSNNDKISKESYDKTNDEWTWERKVIFNGDEITLTEVGSDISVLKSLAENVWYEITYKADGTVKSAKYAYYTESGKRVGATASDGDTTPKGPALDRTTSINADDAHNFVDKIEWVENAINESGKTNVLYEQVWGKGKDADDSVVNGGAPIGENNAPSLKDGTLYVDTAANKGFYVNSDVKSVLIQKNDGKKTTTYGDNISDLEDILDDLNYNSTNASYCFKISAILTNGHASVVVIHDWNETGATTSGNRNPGAGNGVQWTDLSNVNAPKYFGTAPNDDDIYEMLVGEGYTNISQNGDGSWNYTTPAGLRKTNQTISDSAQLKVTVGSKETYWDNGDTPTWTQVIGETYDNTVHGDFAFVSGAAKNDTNAKAMSSNVPSVTANVEYDIGYYKVTIGGTGYYAKAGKTTIKALMGSAYTNKATDGTYAQYTDGTAKYIGLEDEYTVATGAKPLTLGFYKVSIKDTDTVNYITNTGATKTTAAEMGDTASSWVKTTGGQFVKLDASKKIVGDDLDGNSTAITDDIEIAAKTAYFKITVPKNQTVADKLTSDATDGKYTYAITVDDKGTRVVDTSDGAATDDIFVQGGATITVKVTWAAGDISDGGASEKDTVTVAISNTAATLADETMAFTAGGAFSDPVEKTATATTFVVDGEITITGDHG